MSVIQYSGPPIDPEVPWEVRRHLQLIYQKLGNHTQAFGLQQQAIAKLKSGTTTVLEQGGGSGGGSSTTSGITVNNQSGVTSYATQAGDNLALVVFSDAAAIAVTLSVQSPPWACFIANQGALGAGTVTLTPDTTAGAATISYAGNPGSASMPLLPTYCALVVFDGTNWWAWTEPIVPVTFGSVAHEWLNAYNAATGAFSASQPAFTDISGVATTAQIGTGTPAASKYVDGGTGSWTALPAQPLSGTSASMGGAAMTAGQTITAAVTITGAAVGMVAMTSPQTYPGDSFVWDAYVSAANTVTVRLTAVLAGTPVASVYSVRILQ